jgi:cytochrome c peroxidase
MHFRGCRVRTLALSCVLGGLASTAITAAQENKGSFKLPAEIPTPANNRLTPEREDLGKQLFFEPRLSGSNSISCASCHNPALGWSDALPTAKGNAMKVLGRATPSIANAAYNDLQMWDGRFRSLEEQALGPIQAPAEMNGSMAQIIPELKALPEYTREFERAYPGEGITPETIAKAIASFERTVILRHSPFDQWIGGDQTAIGPSAKRGFELFVGKANCVACHQPPNFTDQGFHNIGLKGNQDEGRFARMPIKASRGAFKTPTLRNVELTAPYMHNGAYRTLAEVVEHYDRGGDEKDNLDPNMKPLGLTPNERQDLIAFMQSLTDRTVVVSLPKLP